MNPLSDDFFLKTFFAKCGDFFSNVWNVLNPKSDNFIFKNFFIECGDFFIDLGNKLNPKSENFIFKSFFTKCGDFFSDLGDKLNPKSENFIFKNFFANCGDFFGNIWRVLNPLSDDFFLKTFFAKCGEFFSNVWNVLNPLSDDFWGHKLIDLFKDLLNFLFVPDEEYFEKIKNNWESHFTFISSIKEAVYSIQNMIENISEAPKFNIHINKNNFIDEGDYTIMDLSWYSPYKIYGDLVLTGFLYILFFWNLFKHIPRIIDGFGLISSHSDDDERS